MDELLHEESDATTAKQTFGRRVVSANELANGLRERQEIIPEVRPGQIGIFGVRRF